MTTLAFLAGCVAGGVLLLVILLAGDFEQRHPMGGRRL